jgi:hypothetical protein
MPVSVTCADSSCSDLYRESVGASDFVSRAGKFVSCLAAVVPTGANAFTNQTCQAKSSHPKSYAPPTKRLRRTLHQAVRTPGQPVSDAGNRHRRGVLAQQKPWFPRAALIYQLIKTPGDHDSYRTSALAKHQRKCTGRQDRLLSRSRLAAT